MLVLGPEGSCSLIISLRPKTLNPETLNPEPKTLNPKTLKTKNLALGAWGDPRLEEATDAQRSSDEGFRLRGLM